MASYNDALKVAQDEASASFSDVVGGLRRCDATTLVGRMRLPRCVSGERVLVVRYDGDGRKFAVATTGAPQLVNVTAASSFVLRTIGAAVDGVQLSVADNAVEGTVVIPLLGEDPYPAVDEALVRWAVGQAVKAGAVISAVSFYTALSDAGVADSTAKSMIGHGFRRYARVMEGCDLWAALMSRR